MIEYIVIGSIASFVIFWSVSGMLLRVIMSMKNTYCRTLNAFTFRQISSKINTMVFSMTVICLMLFITICTCASAFSVRNSMNANLNELCPADFETVTRHTVQTSNKTRKLNLLMAKTSHKIVIQQDYYTRPSNRDGADFFYPPEYRG